MHDLRLLTAFAQAAQSGSFTAAAQVLRCSPGAVSKNIARLEQDIGIRLFNRTTRQLCLSTEGEQFYQVVRRSLAELERADDIVLAARQRIEGTVRLIVGGAFGKYQVLPSLSRLLERHPGLQLEVAISDDPGDLVARGYDLAVRCGSPGDSRYICRRLGRLPLRLVASPGYVDRHGAPKHPAELQQHNCVNVRHGDQNCAWAFSPPPGSAERVVKVVPQGRLLIIEQMEAIVAAAVGGFGLTVIDKFAAAPHLANGSLVELLPEWGVESCIEGGSDIYLVYPHRDYVPLRVRTVIDFLVDEFSGSLTSLRDTRVPPSVPVAPRSAVAMLTATDNQ